MSNMHHIVAGLSDADMTWLFSRGKFRKLKAGASLIGLGRPVKDLYFVTQGQLAVRLPDGTRVALLGEGDVIGETSFVEGRVPGVNVKAEGEAEVMAVPVDAILERFEQEPVFAARFYRALAVFLSEKLRETTAIARGIDGEKVAEPVTIPPPNVRVRRLVTMFRRA